MSSSCCLHPGRAVQVLLAAPACGDRVAELVLQDATLAGVFELLLEAQSGGVHPGLQQQVAARAAALSLVRVAGPAGRSSQPWVHDSTCCSAGWPCCTERLVKGGQAKERKLRRR